MTPRRLAAAWYGHEFLRELVLIYPVYAVMMGAAGVSPFELTVLFACWAGIVVLLEVPSGVLADLWPRRHLLLLANLLRTSAFLTWLALPGFWGYLAGFLVWGTGSALASGAAEALLFDSLKADGQEAGFARVFGRGRAAASAGVGLALLGGGWAGEMLGYQSVLVLSAGAPLLACLPLLLLPVGRPPRASAGVGSDFASTLRAGLAELRASALLRWLALALAVLATIYGTFEEFVGPLLAAQGQALGAIGLVYALCHGSRTLAMAVAERGEHLPLGMQLATWPLAGLVLMGAAWPAMPLWLVATLLMVYFALCALAEVWLLARLQHGIAGDARATVTSAASLGIHLMGSVWFLLSGGVAEAAGWPAATAFLGAMSLLLGSLAWLLRPRIST